MVNNELDKQAAYKEAFLSTLATKGSQILNKVKGSYVMDAVRKAHPQHLRAAAEDSMTLHGMVLDSLRENGAVGADTIKKGLTRGRVFLGDVDTALGAMAVGKKGVTDPTHDSLRKKLFTFTKGNERTLPKNQYGMGGTRNQTRPSISAPIHTISGMVVPSLAMMKGQELIANYKNRKEVNPSGA